MKRIILIISLLTLISACSYYASNGEKLYLASRNGSLPVVPPPLTDATISHFYDLPLQNQHAVVSIKPPSV